MLGVSKHSDFAFGLQNLSPFEKVISNSSNDRAQGRIA